MKLEQNYAIMSMLDEAKNDIEEANNLSYAYLSYDEYAEKNDMRICKQLAIKKVCRAQHLIRQAVECRKETALEEIVNEAFNITNSCCETLLDLTIGNVNYKHFA